MLHSFLLPLGLISDLNLQFLVAEREMKTRKAWHETDAAKDDYLRIYITFYFQVLHFSAAKKTYHISKLVFRFCSVKVIYRDLYMTLAHLRWTQFAYKTNNSEI